MNLIIWIAVGGIVGWIASMIMRSDAQQGALMNIVTGIAGALFGGWLIAPLVASGTINQGDFSLVGLGISLFGAIILLALVSFVRRIGSR